MTNEELVTLAGHGDTDTFNQLILRWERPIHSLSYRMIGRDEDARVVCQEAFLRAFRGIKGFKGHAKFSSWLYRIALNLCRDWLRRERRGGTVQPSEGFELDEQGIVDRSGGSAVDLVVRHDLTRAVSQIMATLPEDPRAVSVLKEYHGFTFREVAELLGCPVSTAKTRLYQGLTVLRRQLEPSSTDALRLTTPRPGTAMNTPSNCTEQTPESLMAYLYDECEPGERDRLDAHLATCRFCIVELESLHAVRGTLQAWSPPDASLGFRIVSEGVKGAPVVAAVPPTDVGARGRARAGGWGDFR